MSKEFDEVAIPADKKEVKKIIKQEETFTDVAVVDKKEEQKPASEWETFFQQENEKYAKTVKQKAEHAEFSLPIVNGDGTTVKTIFSRKNLTVAELRKLNSLQKQYNELPKEENSLFQAEELASLYLEYAQLLLINNTTDKKMSQEEFEQQDWANIRAIIDNCILKSIIGSTG